jgi:hypothetical protein
MGSNLMRWLNFTESPKRTMVPKGAKTMAKTTCPRYALCGGHMARHTAPNQQPSPRKAPKGFVNLVVIIWEILESRGKRAESDTVTLVMTTPSCVWVALVSLSLTFVNTFAICQMSPSLAPHGLCTHPLFISFNRACLKANSQLWGFALHSRTVRPFAMLFAMFLLAGLATAARYCVEADPPIPEYDPNKVSLPACTVSVKSARA